MLLSVRRPTHRRRTPARPVETAASDKEKFKQQKEVREELKGPYQKWVDEDVHWIISDTNSRPSRA